MLPTSVEFLAPTGCCTRWHGFSCSYSNHLLFYLFFQALELFMVHCEAQLGNTGNSVRLILVLGSSTKLKSVMQLWVARQSSSGAWPVFRLTEPWQRESGVWGGLHSSVCGQELCWWNRAAGEFILVCLPLPQTEVSKEELRIWWMYALVIFFFFLRLPSSWAPFLCLSSLLKGRWALILLLKPPEASFAFPSLKRTLRARLSGWEEELMLVMPREGGSGPWQWSSGKWDPIRLFLGHHPCCCCSLLAPLVIFHIWFSSSFIKSVSTSASKGCWASDGF